MPKVVDHEDYQDDLLDKAFDILAQRGYACPMREIASTIGVSTGTLYHYFPSKKALFEKMVARIGRGSLAKAVDLVTNESTLTDRLTLLFELLICEGERLTATMMLSIEYGRQSGKPESSAFFQKFFDQYTSVLSQILALPDALCELIIAACDGILLHHWVDPDAKKLRHRLLLFRDMIVTYVA